MSGVDYHDQMLAYYPCRRKTLRWYKKLGIHVFQTMLLNSYYMYNSQNENKMSPYDFRLNIIEQLLGQPPIRNVKATHLPNFGKKMNAEKRREGDVNIAVVREKKENIQFFVVQNVQMSRVCVWIHVSAHITINFGFVFFFILLYYIYLCFTYTNILFYTYIICTYILLYVYENSKNI